MRKWLAVAAAVVGLVLLVGAGVVRWIVAPQLAVLPGDTDTTRTYTGTAATLLNAQSLSSSDGAPALLHHVPVTLSHRTKVLETDGDNALVSDSGSVLAAGSPIGGFDYRYAVDRTDMGRGSGFSGVVPQSGITFNFPIHTAPHDYPGWVSDTRSTVPLTYEGTATHGGLATYVFRTDSSPTLIDDPQTLKSLAAALPKATVVRLAAGLHLSADEAGALAQVLPSLPDPVPFSYTFRTSATYWVEPTTGEIVDLKERDVRTLSFDLGGLLVPVTPVVDMTYTSSPAQLAAAVKDARHDAGQINLLYRTVPLFALLAGPLFLVGAAAGLLIPRRRTVASTSPVEAAVAEPAREFAARVGG